jgi:hypothetical protein
MRAAILVLALCGCSQILGIDNFHGHDGGGDGAGDDDGSLPPVCPACTPDNTGIVDCGGHVTPCGMGQSCSNATCMDACAAAEQNRTSVGCDFYAVDMDAAQGAPKDACFAVFVTNTSLAPVHIAAEWNGATIDVGQFAKLPSGQGTAVTYAAYDPVHGLDPGRAAILFLAFATFTGNIACPVPAAIGTDAQIDGTGKGHAFHITTDLPVAAHQMLPYGVNSSAAGATVLLPTSAWGDGYLASSANDVVSGLGADPSHNFVAKDDNTTITLRPRSAIAGGGGIPAGAANTPLTLTLNRGDYVQISQGAPLTGSPISGNKPFGVFGGHQILNVDQCCGDHAEQMIAPVRAAGSEYVAAPHGDRKAGEGARLYHIVGTVDGTALTYDPPGLGQPGVAAGQTIEVRSATPFIVRSQDGSHPFLMFTYMSGGGEQGMGGLGDPDFVRLIPPAQYLRHYTFFTDTTFAFTTLTVVREKSGRSFQDVSLACAGTLGGWQPVGTSGRFEITFAKIADHFNAVGTCANGVQTMNSNGRFGVWAWGWGSEDTSTGWVSYGFAAGEAAVSINNVVP